MVSANIIKKYLTNNSDVQLFLDDGDIVNGCIIEFLDEDNAVLIQTEKNIEYILCESIKRFSKNILDKINNPIEDIKSDKKDLDDVIGKNLEPIGITDNEAKNFNNIEEKTNKNDNNNDQEIRNIKLMFSGSPKLDMPNVDFKCSKIKDKDFLKEITRYKNIYDNAIKMGDHSKIKNIIPELIQKQKLYLEKTPHWSYINYLVGMFIYAIGKDLTDAEKYLKSAYEGNYLCALELACVEIKQEQFANAFNHLVDEIYHEKENQIKDDIVRVLGQCAMRLDKCPVFGHLLEVQGISDDAKDMIWYLILFFVKDDIDAVGAVKNRDIELLRKTKAGNNIFHWSGTIQKEYINEIEKNVASKEEFSQESILKERRGTISAFYKNKGIGFIIEEGSRQTWFFNVSSIWDDNLISSLEDGNSGQEVVFWGDNLAIDGKYPTVRKVQLVSTKDFINIDSRAPLSVRLRGLPKNSTFYAQAKRAEQLDQLNDAKVFYYKEIENRDTKYFKSAIKDLATLLNREDKPLDAIALLDKYSLSFTAAEMTSLSQMKVQFLIKAKKYEDAAKILVDLAKKPSDKKKRVAYLQQEAFCYYAMGEYDKAIAKLENLRKSFPGNEAVSQLLEKIKTTKESGLEYNSEVQADINEVSKMFEGHLSLLAQLRLQMCNYDGVDVRSRENNNYTIDDITRVEKLKDKLFGFRPLERSKYLLTLAKLAERLISISDRNQYLVEYFISMAKYAAYKDYDYHIEEVHCYAGEALQLIQPNKNNKDKIKKFWALLLTIYNSSEMPQPKDLLEPQSKDILKYQCEVLFENTQAWKKFVDDLPIISSKYSHCFSILLDVLQQFDVINIPKINEAIKTPIDECFALVNNLKALNWNQIHQIRECFLKVKLERLYELDRSRAESLIQTLDKISNFSREIYFTEKERYYLQIVEDVRMQIEEILSTPTTLSIEKFYPIFKELSALLKSSYDELLNQGPELEITNLVGSYPYDGGEITVKLQVDFLTASAPPIDRVSITTKNDYRRPKECLIPEGLRFGKTEFEFCFKPTELDIKEKKISLDLYVSYLSRNKEEKEVGPFAISVLLGEPMSEEIKNPFLCYSSGKPIAEDDDSMFFGRKDLINRIVEQISIPYQGHCFVLYGQKRSGKTSVIYKISKSLPPNTIYSYVSAASFNETGGNTVELMCEELYAKVNSILKQNYKTEFDFDFSEKNLTTLLKLNKIKNFLKERGYGWVVAIDEFTNIYANSKEDTKRFMHTWKTLIEQNIFNAIIIGQDTMPRFKKDYPNDFCVTIDERISCLDKDSVMKMASEPILYNGESRFKGEALNKIFNLTAGSPYFMQKLCSNIVDYMNEHKSPYVSGADIDNVAESMSRGEDRMHEEEFDGLISSGDDVNAVFSRDSLMPLLTKISKTVPDSCWCRIDNLYEIEEYKEKIEDLVSRDTLEKNEDQVRIKAGLLSRWLRINK